MVFVLRELLTLILTEVKAIEGVFKGERVGDLKLFPRYNTTRADLVGLHFETAVFVAKQMSLLSEDAGQDSHDCPTEEATICRRIATVEKGILLL